MPVRSRSFLAALGFLGLVQATAAQPYPPPYATPRPARGGGLNCETMAPGTLFTPPGPFTCPLRGRRPLGAQCFCRAPAEYGDEDWEGRVIP